MRTPPFLVLLLGVLALFLAVPTLAGEADLVQKPARCYNLALATSTPCITATVTVDRFGNALGAVDTYVATSGSEFPTPTSTGLWFEIVGSSTRTVGVRRITLTGLTQDTPEYVAVLAKVRAASTGGTPLALDPRALDPESPAPTAGPRGFAVSPTAGTAAETVGLWRAKPANTTPAAGDHPPVIVLDFTSPSSPHGLILADETEALTLEWKSAPGTSVSLTLAIDFVEF